MRAEGQQTESFLEAQEVRPVWLRAPCSRRDLYERCRETRGDRTVVSAVSTREADSSVLTTTHAKTVRPPAHRRTSSSSEFARFWRALGDPGAVSVGGDGETSVIVAQPAAQGRPVSSASGDDIGLARARVAAPRTSYLAELGFPPQRRWLGALQEGLAGTTALLARHRVLTLDRTPGVGKTRLGPGTRGCPSSLPVLTALDPRRVGTPGVGWHRSRFEDEQWAVRQ